ncbi:MAG: hypothetical protein P1U68_06985 [Verrucomicrobiales bacterium]|nr:hypothetical protein [Verrucomicrobiales bacterium]
MNLLCRELLLIAVLVSILPPLLSGDEGEKESPDYAAIETKSGRTYFDCFVKSSDAEGIVIQHRDGMARLSLFDLTPEMQAKFNFDPVIAMKTYRDNEARNRELRKQRLLEAAKLQAEAERRATMEEMQAIAQEEWTPIEADIVKITGDGAYARVKQISFLPTTQTSTLGFETPGPPKRVTRSYGTGLIFLQSAGHPFTFDEKWKGYLDPVSIRLTSDLATGEKTVPVHLAVPPR